MAIHNNDLQRIATAVQGLYSPKGALVTGQARKLRDGTGQVREIDVLVEYEEEGQQIRVAVEAKDWKKALDQPIIEQYIGKYSSGSGGVQVDKVIIVGRSFTEPVQRRAEMLGFELHTIKTLSDSVSSYFSPAPESNASKNVEVVREKEKIVPYLIGSDGKGINPDVREQGFLIHRSSGTNCGTPTQWITKVEPWFHKKLEEARKLQEGVMINGVLEINLSGYLLRRLGKDHPLDCIRMISSAQMNIPKLSAQLHELYVNGDKSNELVTERHVSKYGTIEITYRRPLPGQGPNALYIQSTTADGKPGTPTATLKIKL